MPRDGAVIFNDLIGKLILRVTCSQCGATAAMALPVSSISVAAMGQRNWLVAL